MIFARVGKCLSAQYHLPTDLPTTKQALLRHIKPKWTLKNPL
jgi:hypothetical protein